MGAVTPWRPAPASLDEVRDPDEDAEDLYPRRVLRNAKTALCLFSAAWHGRQDAYWLYDAGVQTMCVDTDGAKLREMSLLYPNDWTFLERDAFEVAMTAYANGHRWDIVSLDPFSSLFDQCIDFLEVWCQLAGQAVIMGCKSDAEIPAPRGWFETERLYRSDFCDGVSWVVLQPT